ncbi:polysaccharide deacetylase family protein [Ponticaulis koreensis]|uniref:polysaccharide deacetylase family protein n=1 Tax=Ponticaulis koreensis TaxID=1123045 RepID=UPI0003B57005|nr:polysaccharide deacetylase family protein [Ponticaulis koreensis]
MALKPLLSTLTMCLALALPSGAQSDRRIALTYDDAPRGDSALQGDERVEMLINGLDAAGVEQAAIFVVTERINSPERLARIQSFADAGHVIANHSHTHPWLRNVTAEEYLAEIDTAEMILQVFENRRPWFRFPYLNEAPDIERRDAVRAGLAERDLFSGYVTVDTYDWHLDSLYQSAISRGQNVCMSSLRDLYTGMLVEAANFYDQAAREYLDEVPAQVMLLHENDVAALFVTDLVAALEADGWEIISADEAYEDPIASVLPDTRFLGMGRVAALTSLAGKPGPEFTYLAVEEDQINAVFEDRALGACD